MLPPEAGSGYDVTVAAGETRVICVKLSLRGSQYGYSYSQGVKMSDEALIEDCIANGTPQTKGEPEDNIKLYYTISATGGCLVYKNESADKTLEETLNLELVGYKTPGHDDPTNIELCVGPGETKVVKLETCEGATAFSFSFSCATAVVAE